MSRNLLETVLGAVVLVAAAAFLVFAYERSGIGRGTGGYELVAQFDAIDGLDVGAPVRISGIQVGQVTAADLNRDTFRARITFTVADGIEIPSDSTASIASTSLLGGKYLAVSPGGDVQILSAGGEITYTQPSINIERLIGQYVFGGGGQAGGAQGGAETPPPAADPFSSGGGTNP
ncbi:outer membrane lipid asymmetry maintenance protein MlaD [Marinivivus vitaminiproducens]|uniref:outer membrane lipid asymmetry maintenance protein MlaD n=1 Tax=Marinivivus vitaminiproducens TaxID=3035935 RepID=UPI0027A64549|nr:outer membrane lipid asymmetry maintenance protein MlaD [Geminicoccaceae bacterium SCSIO 64248]